MNQVATPTERTTTETASRMRPKWVVPPGNIRETKDSYVVELEMPGVRKEGLEITVEGNELTIVGHKHEPEVKGTVVYRESRPYEYRRVFDMDPSIDADKIEAKMEQGVLVLTLPKTEKVKPRKITVGE